MEDQQGPSRRFIMIDYQAGQRGLLQIVKGGKNQVGRRRDRGCGRMEVYGAMRDRSVAGYR